MTDVLILVGFDKHIAVKDYNHTIGEAMFYRNRLKQQTHILKDRSPLHHPVISLNKEREGTVL